MKKKKAKRIAKELFEKIYRTSCTPDMDYNHFTIKKEYSEAEIRELEESLNEQGKKLLDSVYYKRIPINKNMKEKNCLNCKNVSLQGMVFECTKNNLDINKPQTHSCNMYEENVETLNIIIRNVKLNGSMIEITLFDLDNEKDICTLLAPRGNANKFIVGEKFKYKR